MAEKKLMPILRTGRFRAMSGDQVLYTVEDLTRLADNYDPENFRAPLFLDAGWHTSLNGDAAGWVMELVVEGEILYGLVGDSPPEVKQAVAEGRRRQVSAEISYDTDGKAQGLRRVALLGASVPAVQGLPELNVAMFADGRKVVRLTTNFEEEDMGIFGRKNPEGGSQPAAKPEEKSPAPETRTPESQAPPAAAPAPAALTQGEDRGTVKLSAEVAELRASNASLKTMILAGEIKAFTDNLTREGKLPPGLNTPGLHAFMAGLSEKADKTIMLSQAQGEPRPASPAEFFRSFLEGLPVLVREGHAFTQGVNLSQGQAEADDREAEAMAASVNN